MADWSLPQKLSVARLREIADPFGTTVWEYGPVTKEQVARALETRSFIEISFSDTEGPEWSTWNHARRIAYLVTHGWADPITIDVPPAGYEGRWWPITDGNHRFAAAVYRKDRTILAHGAGSISRLEDLLYWRQRAA